MTHKYSYEVSVSQKAKNVIKSHLFVGSRACAANHYVIAEKVSGMSNLRRLRRASITRSLTLGKCRNAYGIAEE